MSTTQVTWRRGTEAQNKSFIGATGEITIDYENHRIIVHDNITQGGWTGAKINDLNTAITNLTSYVNTGIAGIQSIVYTTGQQNISGNKTFYSNLDNNKSIDVYNRQLFGSTGGLVFDWSNQVLYDTLGIENTNNNTKSIIFDTTDVFLSGPTIYLLSDELTTLSGKSALVFGSNAACIIEGGRISGNATGNYLDIKNNSKNTKISLTTAGTIDAYASNFNFISGKLNCPDILINNTINFFPQNTGASFILSDKSFYINTSTGAVIWTLPTISSCTGRLYLLKNIGNLITLTGQGSNKIYSSQPVLSYTIFSGESYQVANDGNFWQLM